MCVRVGNGGKRGLRRLHPVRSRYCVRYCVSSRPRRFIHENDPRPREMREDMCAARRESAVWCVYLYDVFGVIVFLLSRPLRLRDRVWRSPLHTGPTAAATHTPRLTHESPARERERVRVSRDSRHTHTHTAHCRHLATRTPHTPRRAAARAARPPGRWGLLVPPLTLLFLSPL